MDRRIDEFLEEIGNDNDDELLYPTDLKEAIIGKMEFFDGANGQIERIVLDKTKCLEILMRDDIENGVSEEQAYEDALEHFYYNVIGSYVEGVPAYVTLIDDMYY